MSFLTYVLLNSMPWVKQDGSVAPLQEENKGAGDSIDTDMRPDELSDIPLAQLIAMGKQDGSVAPLQEENKGAGDSIDTDMRPDELSDIPIALLIAMGKRDGSIAPLQEENKGAGDSIDMDMTRPDELSDIPLAQLISKRDGSVAPLQEVETGVDSDSNDMDTQCDEISDSDGDPDYKPGACEVGGCKKEVWIACPECEILLCYDHSEEDISSCSQHGKLLKSSKRQQRFKRHSVEKRGVQPIEMEIEQIESQSVPEQFAVEGSEREVAREKRQRVNKQKEAKMKRNKGLEYTSVKTKNSMKARELKPRCSGGKCGKKCSEVTDEQRMEIFQSFWNLGDLRLQSEFVVRPVERAETKRSRTSNKESHRKQTLQYSFTVDQREVPVCKVFFHNTLGVSEQTTKTALKKVMATGVLEPEKRGGKVSEQVIARDRLIRDEILAHLDLFPKVGSHFCRSSSNREYLHPDLTKRKMFNMFLAQWLPRTHPPSFSLYKKLFKEKNLSITKPKKDQCSLCMTYRQGNDTDQANLQDRYDRHIAEKEMVRKLKDECKEAAQQDQTIVSACFDLQQVIYLPVSNENALFYKRRLANYNLTMYDIADRNCHCFTWSETDSKRGASEIATVVHRRIKMYDNHGIQTALLFSDGCSGQNKNSIMPAMMLHAVTNSINLKEISLRFFESFHGQNEGDSVHSAIHSAVQTAGNLFQPTQLVPIFSLARPKQPYIVHQLKFEDFLDFKSLSKELRILDARRDSIGDEVVVPWNSIMELRVLKSHPSTIFYKTSHMDTEFKTIALKRLKQNVKDIELKRLNTEENKISKEKYKDLVSLCSGDTPLVRLKEHQQFYLSLPHQN